MPRAKIAITIDENALTEVDRLVDAGVFPNRSQAFEIAITERLERIRHTRLAREAAKLDPVEERGHAEERFAGEVEWPEY